MIDILEEAARKAGDILLHYYTKGVNPKNKTSHHDLITEADPEAQQAVISLLTKALVKKGIPQEEIGFLGEEDSVNSEGTYKFVIDPLDGTNNFASGLPYFCVCIALFINDKLTAGVVYDPTRDTLYKAEKNKGAYKVTHGKSIKLLTPPQTLEQVILATTLSQGKENLITFIRTLRSDVREVRILGSAALDLCLVADGSAIVARYGTKAWDIAAAHIILEEAGNKLTDWNGKEIQYDLSDHGKKYPHVGAHPSVLKEVLSVTKKLS